MLEADIKEKISSCRLVIKNNFNDFEKMKAIYQLNMLLTFLSFIKKPS